MNKFSEQNIDQLIESVKNEPLNLDRIDKKLKLLSQKKDRAPIFIPVMSALCLLTIGFFVGKELWTIYSISEHITAYDNPIDHSDYLYDILLSSLE